MSANERDNYLEHYVNNDVPVFVITSDDRWFHAFVSDESIQALIHRRKDQAVNIQVKLLESVRPFVPEPVIIKDVLPIWEVEESMASIN